MMLEDSCFIFLSSLLIFCKKKHVLSTLCASVSKFAFLVHCVLDVLEENRKFLISGIKKMYWCNSFGLTSSELHEICVDHHITIFSAQ